MERTCVGCGAKADPSGLVRLAADGAAVVVDAPRRRGGRGAWLHAAPRCLAQAVKRRAFARALRRDGLAVDAEALGRRLTEMGRKD